MAVNIVHRNEGQIGRLGHFSNNLAKLKNSVEPGFDEMLRLWNTYSTSFCKFLY